MTVTVDDLKAEPTKELVNSSFSKKINNLQIAWDSTSIGDLKTCPRYYFYRIVCGYAYPGSNPHLRFGSLFAKSTEWYGHLRAERNDHEAALTQVIRKVLLETVDKILITEKGEVEERYYSSEKWGEILDDKLQLWISDEPTKTQKTLLRTIILYFDKFKDDTLETVILASGKPAVELSFSIDLTDLDEEFRSPSGESYILCGHLDRFTTWNDGFWISDNKTTKGALDQRYFANYNPDNQVSTYDVAGNIVFKVETEGVIIDAAQILVGGSRFMRRPIPRTPGQREEWLHDLKFYLRMNEEYVRLNYWPMNDKSCTRFGRRCEFADICGADPSTRQDLLDAHFVKRQWDPLKPR